MGKNFYIKRVNSPFEDTAFFVKNVHKKSAFLFDCGRLGGLDNSEILNITDIFISHTHMDHFYGFDRVLRGILRSDSRVRFYGPKGIIENVKGKLSGYTWNLVKNYKLVIEVVELSLCDANKIAVFHAQDGFKPLIFDFNEFPIDIGDGFYLSYEFFYHDITSVGYRVSEPIHINFNKDAMNTYGYIPGSWLGELKEKLKANQKYGTIFVNINGISREISVIELEKQIVIYSKPEDITFITDIAPTFDNFKKAVNFAYSCKTLLIEGMFMMKDVLHAIDKNHLTINLSKEIFRLSKAGDVKFFHFAPKYESDKNTVYQYINKL